MSRPGGTLVELARRCEVSPSTVSRVLNNSKQGRFSVSAEVRERILRTARLINYRPSMAARNLATGKTKLIAVLGLGGLNSERVGPVEAAAKALDRSGYEICLQFLSLRQNRFALAPLRVDGVVAVGAREEEDIAALEEHGVPYVSINGLFGPTGSSVNPDDARGVRIALNHLYDLGHRRIAYLDHFASGAIHHSVFERRTAFREVAATLGVEVPPMDLSMMPSAASWDSSYRPFLRQAVIECGATAVLCYSHLGAMALCRDAHDLGLSVPRDFSLVCFNNESVLRLWVPSITAIEIPAARMGQLAADILLQHLASPTPLPPVNVRLEESLVIRESSVPPNAAPGEVKVPVTVTVPREVAATTR